MSKCLKKMLIISVSAITLLSLGTGVINVNASKRSVRTHQMAKKKRRLTKRQKIRMEHKYFTISSYEASNPNWYVHHADKIMLYTGDDPDASWRKSNGKYYTNRARSFMVGFNDSSDSPYKMKRALKRHHLNPADYKAGWVIGSTFDPTLDQPDMDEGLTEPDFTMAFSNYHLVKYGPTRKQRMKWTRFERLNMSPTSKQVNNPKWYLKHYRKDYEYYSNQDKNYTRYPKSYFMTRQGRSFDDGANDGNDNVHHKSIKYLTYHHFNVNSYKAGWIMGYQNDNYQEDDYTTAKDINQHNFAKWIKLYNSNRKVPQI